MNFLLLKEIVLQLKHKFRCPKCRKNYSNRDIYLLNTMHSVFDVVLSCRSCGTQVYANVALSEEGNPGRKHRGIKVKANSYSIVSENDVLDMKNFLKDFKGSFKTIFANDDKK